MVSIFSAKGVLNEFSCSLEGEGKARMFCLFYILETALQEEVEKSLNLRPTYETLVSRSQLASV